jgi:peptide/nickel transport system ATP-binding protein
MLTANEILEWDDEGVAAPLKPLLFVDNLVKHFATKTWFFGRTTSIARAVDGVSFTVNEGEAFGIAGPPGSGKSTIAYLLMRLIQPDSGVFRWRGLDVGSPALPVKRYRRDVQMVLQDASGSLDPRLQVGRSIALGSAARGLSRTAANASARELMARVGLEPKLVADRYPHELHEGQRLRVNLARALASSPKLLVFDEIAGGFDKEADLQFLDLLRDLGRERNLTYIFLSRHLSLAQSVCDRVAYLQSGRIVRIEARETP